VSKFCTRCGSENSDDANFCKVCGAPLEPAKQPSPPPQQYAPPPGYGQQMFQSNPEMLLYSNLQSLRSAFFWMFLGIILSIIPIVNIVGGIILFIAFILLILAFGKVANTSLPHAAEYKSTKNWLLFLLIFDIVGSIILASVIIVAVFIVTATTSSTRSSYLSINTLGIGAIAAIGILFVLMLIFYIITYLKVVNSLKSLGADLSVQTLHKAGNYLFYALIISIVGDILLPVFFYVDIFVSSISAAKISLYSIFLILLVPLIVIIAAYILEILSFHNAYTGIDEFLNRPRGMPAPPMQQYPPQQPQSPEPPKFSF